jgi:hypothetical protein
MARHRRIACKTVLAHDVVVRIDPGRNGKDCVRIINCEKQADRVSNKAVRIPVDSTFIAADNFTSGIDIQSKAGSGIAGTMATKVASAALPRGCSSRSSAKAMGIMLSIPTKPISTTEVRSLSLMAFPPGSPRRLLEVSSHDHVEWCLCGTPTNG